MENKKVAVLGFGITGQAVVKFLISRDAEVSVFEKNPSHNFPEEILRRFSDVDFYFETNDFSPEDFDLIVTSPGVNTEKNPSLKKANDLKIPIYNDVTLFIETWRKIGPIVGVTGSNGKSTTVSLLYECVRKQTPAILAGNIGTSPLDFLEMSFDKGTVAILELSSYQLELFRENHYLDICLLTNLSSNHVDRYDGSMALYGKAKMMAVNSEKTKFITTTDDEGVKKYILPNLSVEKMFDVSFLTTPEKAENDGVYKNNKNELVLKDGEKIEVVFDKTEKRNLIGLHNLYNIAFVVQIINLLGLDIKKSVKEIRNFKGLEHRIEKVREIDGVPYINDSKATSPAATEVAIRTLQNGKNLILIAGGNDKGMDFSSLGVLFRDYVKELILLPGSADINIGRIADENDVPIKRVKDMEEAVLSAKKIAKKGEMVLLSPSATSLSQYKDFEQRGEHFREILLRL